MVHGQRATSSGILTLIATLTGCAPPSSLPPPVPMGADQSLELGGAASLGGLISQRTQTDHLGNELSHTVAEPAVGGQLWGDVDLGQRLRLGGTLFLEGYVDTGVAGGGGLFARMRMDHSARSYVGLQVELGWAYGSAGLPVAYEVVDGIWVYTTPSLGFSYRGLLRLPAGFSLALSEQMLFSAELGMQTDLPAPLQTDYLRGPVLSGAAGLSYRR